MLRKWSAVAALSILALSIGRVGEAAPINFGSLSQDGASQRSLGSTVTEDGFVFTSNNLLTVWQRSASNHPDGGDAETSLMDYFAGATTTMAKVGGGAFNLFSIDLAPWGVVLGNFPAFFNVAITGTRSNTTSVTQTFSVANQNNPGQPELQTFFFTDFTDLVSVSFFQGVYADGMAFQFNNIDVDGGAVGAPVPEPASLVLFGTGVAAAAWRRRRSRVA